MSPTTTSNGDAVLNQLLDACRKEDLSEVKRIVKQQHDEDKEVLFKILTCKGDTPINVACQVGNRAIFDYLYHATVTVCGPRLSESQILNRKNDYGMTYLMTAILYHSKSIATGLIFEHPDANTVDSEGYTPLTAMFIEDDDVDEDELMELNNFLMTYMLGALTHTTLPENRRIKVDMQDGHGETPLMLAVDTGNTFRVKALLHYKADPNVKNKAGHLPLANAVDKACRSSGAEYLGDKDILLDLLHAGADMNRKGLYYRATVEETPLKIAEKKPEVLRLLQSWQQGRREQSRPALPKPPKAVKGLSPSESESKAKAPSPKPVPKPAAPKPAESARTTRRSPERSSRRSPERSSRRSPDRNRSSRRSPERSSRRSPERSSRRSPERSYRRSPERSSRRSPERSYRRSPERSSRRSPERSYRRSPERSSRRSPERRSAVAQPSVKAPLQKPATAQPKLVLPKRIEEKEEGEEDE